MNDKMETKEQWDEWLVKYPKVVEQFKEINPQFPDKYPAIMCHEPHYKGKHCVKSYGDVMYWFLGNMGQANKFTHYEYMPENRQSIHVEEYREYKGDCPICGSYEETDHPEAGNGVHECSECGQELEIEL